MPTTNARRRALQDLMVSSVGAPPMLAPRPPEDLLAIAPDMPQATEEGVATERLYSAPEPTDELAALRQRTGIGSLMADLGQSTSRAIETLTGAPGTDIYSGMRARASEPLKDYLRLQEQKQKVALKPGSAKLAKSTDPKSQESQRAQAIFKQAFPSEDASSITESNLDVAMRTMLGVRGQEGVAGRSAATITQRALDREQRSAEAAAREDRLWADMSQDERLAMLRIEDAREAREAAATAKMGEQTSGLRKELEGHQTVKDYRSSKVAVDKLRAAAKDPSAAGDLSLIFSFMKILDPGSVVKETEFANAQNATGVPERIRNVWNKAISGERLNPAQRQDFIKSAERLFAAQEAAYNELAAQYEGLAPEGMGSKVVLPARGKPARPKRTTPQQAMPTDAAGNLTLDDSVSITLNGKPKRVPRKNLEALKKMAAEKQWTLEMPNG